MTVWHKAQHRAFARELLAANQNAAHFLTEEILEALVDQKVMQVVLNNHRDVSRASIQALREGIKSQLDWL